MRLYLIRHADPDYPNNTITPAGHLEARALGERMKKLGLDHIYASPLGRAVHTMQYSADALGMSHTIENWTAELNDCHLEFPPLGKIAVWDVPGENIRAKQPYPTHDNWHSDPLFSKPVFRETVKTIARMSDAFFARHGYVREGGRYRIERSNREKIAVFCHGGFGLFWLSHLLEIPLPLRIMRHRVNRLRDKQFQPMMRFQPRERQAWNWNCGPKRRQRSRRSPIVGSECCGFVTLPR